VTRTTGENASDTGLCGGPYRTAFEPPPPEETGFPTTRSGRFQHAETSKREQRQLQKRLKPSKREDLADDYRAGMSVREVAAKYKIHRTTVLRHLERAGVTRRPTTTALSEPDVADARNKRSEGLSYSAIASSFGVNPETVRRWLLKS
jgi:DNA-directed RNA polymerase specialized sigma24 family protein